MEKEFRRVKTLNKTDKRDRGKTDETETETDHFNSQLSQRRKRAKRDSQVPEGEA